MQGTPYFTELQKGFAEWLQRLGYAKATIRHHKRSMAIFFQLVASNGIKRLEDITDKTVLGFQDHLEGLPITAGTLQLRLGSLRLFDRYLQAYGHAPIITVRLMTVPGLGTPRTVPTQAEIGQLYDVTDNSKKGYRDRAMLAIYYGCGLRATEGLDLQLRDLDFRSGLLQVRRTKTRTPRYVPMGAAVMEDLKDYLHGARPTILKTESDTVLVHGNGRYGWTKSLNDRLKKLVERAGLDKDITLHGLRHGIATHLLENGMELEQIRQFLGHRSMQTTQRYTHILYESL